MFEDAGRAVKILAVVVFWLMIVATVVCAFVFGFERWYYYGSHSDFRPGIFFGILFGGGFAAFVNGLVLSCLGEAAECAQEAMNRIYVVKQMLEEKENIRFSPMASASKKPCPKCGIYNDENATVCKNCLTTLNPKPPAPVKEKELPDLPDL